MTPAIHTDDAANPLTNYPDVRKQALAVLSDRSHTDGETVKATVLRALHQEHPTVSLEDVLELNVLVGAPEPGQFDERVGAVLSEAVAQHGDWAGSTLSALGKNTSFPATEEY